MENSDRTFRIFMAVFATFFAFVMTILFASGILNDAGVFEYFQTLSAGFGSYCSGSINACYGG